MDKLLKTLNNLFFLTVVVVLLAMVVWVYSIPLRMMFGPEPVAQASTVVHPRPKTHQVMPGDTVWSIYLEYYAGHDWEEIRYKIGELNGLKNDMLRAYAVIKLPEVE